MTSTRPKLRFVCISDTHNHAPGEGYTLPKGDVLVHAGDLTNQGSYHELKKAATWLEKADFPVKIVVAGNHDLSLDSNYSLKHENDTTVTMDNFEGRELIQSIPGVVYLQHSSTDIKLPGQDVVSFRVFGSPYSHDGPGESWAFQYSANQAAKLWEEIPSDTDVLITHTPPSGVCDASQHWDQGGCQMLMKRISSVRPALHICGHCHEGRGAQIVRWSDHQGALESRRVWEDSAIGTKKQSLLDITGSRSGQKLEFGKETAIVNASMQAKSFGRGSKEFNKAIVVDVNWPLERRN